MLNKQARIFIKWFYWEALQCGYSTKEIVNFLMYDMQLPRGSVAAELLLLKRKIEEFIQQ